MDNILWGRTVFFIAVTLIIGFSWNYFYNDILIAGMLADSPWDLAGVFLIVGLIILVTLCFWLLGLTPVWHLFYLDRLAYSLIIFYLSWDPRLHRFVHMRHWWHHRIVRWLLRFPTSLHIAWELFFGWLLPRRIEPDRVEILLRARLEKAESTAWEQFLAWRAINLDKGITVTPYPPDLQKTLHSCDTSLVALGNYLLCPILPCTHDWPCAETWEMITRMEQQVQRHFVGNIDKDIKLLLTGYYSALEGVPGTSDVTFRKLMTWRRESLERKESFGDQTLFEWRSVLLDRLVQESELVVFAVTGLTFEFTRAEDDQGLIEFFRLLSIHTPYVLTNSDEVAVGEAYCRLGWELRTHNKALSSWAMEQAIKHLYRGEAREHLAQIQNLLEKRDENAR
uniref:Uncharacterized protein n=1 Tax=Candidatus Kentrum sp. FM TaxID=2126340 RepID=A0A450RTW8_9GAMM|nr:MAG: hypothetical protein BECKFM1743A_GA0114220_1000115 [Candidatus Kentron sp. FM]VFJ43355.1 MAG: hypothetical protein BECKFM1743C_GA0114222_1000115 [Candidatus Kentron sp. FM]VFK05509.1 MAG: hypothetical protein BECKFM1743B_GA0114221_1000115 [Candidatus Kentron sp. FM]